MISSFKSIIIKLIDILCYPFLLIFALVSKFIRNKGINRFPITRKMYQKIGLFPITNCYYDPLINNTTFKNYNENNRFPQSVDNTDNNGEISSKYSNINILNGIDFNVEEQLELISKFVFANEIESLKIEDILSDKNDKNKFPFFLPSEAEYYYSLIRYLKPSKIIEIGSGYSTLIALKGLQKNNIESKTNAEIFCIEPYENNWLESTDAKIIRKKVEDIDIDFFKSLQQNDILFIDSSHIIKPHSDVLYEYLQILPMLSSGVVIHIHDIFTPRDYPREWIIDRISFWNEQYLLEAFLMFNNSFKIIGALNYLKNYYFKEFSEKIQSFQKFPNQEPASFWIRKI